MRFLLGSEPVKVFGKVGKVTDHPIEVDDYGVCVVTTDSGQIVTIESSWHAPQWYAPLTSQEECLVVGTEGELHVHYQKSPQLEVSGKGIVGREYYDWLGEERYEVCYRDILIDFATVIRAGHRAPVTGHDGQLALAVIEGSYLSSQTGQEINLLPQNLSS
jgi:predicted dehydrogenase